MKYSDVLRYYRGKSVLITGHTGFKGSWLTRILLTAGARVIGYSQDVPTSPALFEMAGFENYKKRGKLISIKGDVRDLDSITKVVLETKPDILFHLAAQPIVRTSYKNPVLTYETNVIGTVNFMEAIRLAKSAGQAPKSVVVITTDKVYKNEERELWGYREYEPLDGYDPYSNSKSCAELVVHSYRSAFFKSEDGTWSVPISTARAGNVIGGGDFASDRIIPDCVRAVERALIDEQEEAIIAVRNPFSTRPYQHVLEPIAMYLKLAAIQAENHKLSDWYNVGPDDCDCLTTGELVTLFCKYWNKYKKVPVATWKDVADINAPHEATFLKLDSTKIKQKLGYAPRWHIAECVEKTVEFSRVYFEDRKSIPKEMDRQISEFFH